MLDGQKKRKLFWHCRRGMLELDLLLQTFLEKQIDGLCEKEISAFESLLENTDPTLFSWLMGHEEPIDKELKEIVKRIRNNH